MPHNIGKSAFRRGEYVGFAAQPVMAYEAGRTLQIKLEAAAATSGATLSALSGGGVMGLTPDDVKATPEWQAARLAYQRDHAALAAHNAEFLALHGARYAAERRAAREARTLDDLTLNT